jgi:hypothetical protein
VDVSMTKLLVVWPSGIEMLRGTRTAFSFVLSSRIVAPPVGAAALSLSVATGRA